MVILTILLKKKYSVIWLLFENLPKIKYFLAYVNRSIGPTIKIILSVQDNFVGLLPLSNEPSEWLTSV
jgi:hypothetical protein